MGKIYKNSKSVVAKELIKDYCENANIKLDDITSQDKPKKP